MKKVYERLKTDPEYIERQRISSKKHYYKHKEEVLKRMKEYQKNKLNLAKIEMLYELQLERQTDLHTGDITQEDYDKLNNSLKEEFKKDTDESFFNYLFYLFILKIATLKRRLQENHFFVLLLLT